MTLGLESKRNSWTDEELAALREAYGRVPARANELAARLGRGRGNVSRKARELGLTDKYRLKVAPEDKKVRRPMYASMEELRAAQSKTSKERIARQGHPRGALGMKHTEETKAAQSARSKAFWQQPNCPLRTDAVAQAKSDRMTKSNAAGTTRSGFSRCAAGRRPDLGNMHFRSAWEANYARYLNLMMAQGKVVSWEFEPKTFWFEKIRRGTRSYLPDFKVNMPDGTHEWHEVKGWMDPKSKTKLARMAKYYPKEVVRVIGEAWFRQANKGGLAATVPGWERKSDKAYWPSKRSAA